MRFFLVVVLVCLLSMRSAYSLPSQTTITTSILNPEQYFDRIVKIGAPLSLSIDDKYGLLSTQLWGGFELFSEWINRERGGIVVGNERWGVEIVEVDDGSNKTLCNNAARELVAEDKHNVSIFFAPISSYLTRGVVRIAEAEHHVLISVASNHESIWDGSLTYSFALEYYSSFNDPLSMYAARGAITGAYMCNLATSCPQISQATLEAQFSNVGMILNHFIQIDITASTYLNDMESAVGVLAAANVDFVLLNDFDVICIDFPTFARAAGWTPNALFLYSCNEASEVRQLMKTDLYYAGGLTEWYPDENFRSNISGYTTLKYQAMFQKEFHIPAEYIGASAFAGGEILVAAIEEQARRDPSKCLHGPTLANVIYTGSWSTIKCGIPLTFSSLHQAQGLFTTLQYSTTSATRLISRSSELIYPMPAWDSVERTPNYVGNAIDVVLTVDQHDEPKHVTDGRTCDPSSPVTGQCSLRAALLFCAASPLLSPRSNCTVHLPPRADLIINSTIGELTLRDAIGTLRIIGHGATVRPSSTSSSSSPIANSKFLSIIIAPELLFYLHLSNFSMVDFNSIGGSALHLENLDSCDITAVKFMRNRGQIGAAIGLRDNSHVTITSSFFSDNYAQTHAGAVNLEQGNSHVTFSDCVFHQNKAAGFGGAVHVFETNHHLLFKSCLFESNIAQTGGAVFVDRQNENMVFRECTFQNNSANKNAGALHIESLNSNVVVMSTVFLANYASFLGGAVMMHTDNDSIQLSNTSFIHNVATDGSAMYFNTNNFEVLLNSLELRQNWASGSGSIYLNSNNNHMKILMCSFMGNQADKNGAAVFVDSNNQYLSISGSHFVENFAGRTGSVYLNSNNQDCTLTNVTFSHNRAARDGAAVGLVTGNSRFTIQGGLFQNNSAVVAGGAIYSALMNSQLKIIECVFHNCSAPNDGGAVYIGTDHANVDILKSTFSGNRAATGGAIFASRFTVDVFLSSCTFRDNTASQGGAVVMLAERVMISSSNFSGNIASSSAGGMHLEPFERATLTDLIFENNEGGVQGGGLSIVTGTHVDVRRCLFEGNTAVGASALYLYASTIVTIAETVFLGHSAVDSATVSVSDCLDVDITSSTFTDNVVGKDAGALSITRSSAVNVSDCIFSRNTAQNGYGSGIYSSFVNEMRISCSVFGGNQAMLGAGAVFWLRSSGMEDPTGLSSVAPLSGSSACPNQFLPDNQALYGSNVATEAVRLVVGQLSTAGEVLNVTSYVDPMPEFTLVLQDHYRQVVRTQNTNFAVITVKESSQTECYSAAGHLSGQAAGAFSSGVASFAALKPYCAPRHTLTVMASAFLDAQSISLTTDFRISFRDCERGEYYGDSICSQCEMGSFSMKDPSEVSELSQLKQSAVCQRCSPDAEWCHGDQIYLKKGFWRRSESNVRVLPCLLSEDSCVGGNATGEQLCAVGYEQSLCAVCSSGYFGEGGECLVCSTSHFFSITLIIFMSGCVVAVGGLGCLLYYKFVFSKYSEEEKNELRSSIVRKLTLRSDTVVFCNNSYGVEQEGMSTISNEPNESAVVDVKKKEKEKKEGVIQSMILWVNGRYRHLMVQVKIFITTIQVIVSIGSTLGLVMPKTFRDFCDGFSFLQVSISSIYPFSCSTNFTVIDKLILQLLLPVAISILLLIAFFIHYSVKRRRIQNNHFRNKGDKARAFVKIKSKYLNAFLYLTYIILTSLTTSIFQIFLCTNVDPDGEDGESSDLYMTADMSISCESDYYRSGVVIAAIGVCLYPIGIPLLYWLALRKHSREIQDRELPPVDSKVATEVANPLGTAVQRPDDGIASAEEPSKTKRDLSNDVQRLSFLWEAYTPDQWYWEVVETSRRLMLTAVLSVVNPRTSQQAVFACFMSLAYIKLYSYRAPYNDASNNFLAEVGQYQIFLTFFLSLILQNALLPGELWESVVGICLVLVNLGVIIGIGKVEYDAYQCKVRADKEKELLLATMSESLKPPEKSGSESRYNNTEEEEEEEEEEEDGGGDSSNCVGGIEMLSKMKAAKVESI